MLLWIFAWLAVPEAVYSQTHLGLLVFAPAASKALRNFRCAAAGVAFAVDSVAGVWSVGSSLDPRVVGLLALCRAVVW